MEKYRSHLRLRRNILVCFALFAAALGIFDVFLPRKRPKTAPSLNFNWD